MTKPDKPHGPPRMAGCNCHPAYICKIHINEPGPCEAKLKTIEAIMGGNLHEVKIWWASHNSKPQMDVPLIPLAKQDLIEAALARRFKLD